MNAEKVYSLEEQKANRKLWVEALRSGEYKQGRRELASEDGSFCCLGVLCELAGAKYVRRHSYPPEAAMTFVGLRSSNGRLPGGSSLADENDNGASFAAIADIIESEPEGLFVTASES